MKQKTNRRVEAFLLATLPLAVFVGCAGNGETKETTANAAPVQAPQTYTLSNDESNDAAPFTKEANLLIDLVKKEKRADSEGEGGNEPMDLASTDTLENANTNEPGTMESQPSEQPNAAKPETLQVTWVNDTVAAEQDSVGEMDDPMMEVTFSKPKKPQASILHFASAETDTNTDYLALLQQHADFLKNNPNLILTVSGHTDSVGSEQANLKLSEQRALNIYYILLSYGAPESQLIIDALGESSPLYEDATHQENRRVELQYSEEVVLSARQ